ncbi:MAG: hypothetical protein KJ666_04210 [Bacteroidetes bacterium]|nr:hypothetical protein [Bacteroidota bacterium]MBU2584822.1 hypothetical protein [Bacteroidota bacterium]
MSKLVKEGVSATAGVTTGAGVGVAGATGAAAAGTSGAAAITSSLATIGGAVGGGMVAGVAIVGVVAGFAGFFAYKGVRKLGKNFGWWK